MAGSKLRHRVEASTLMEVIVSMVVIVIVFGIAMMIFTNVTRISVSAKQLCAQGVLQEALLDAGREGDEVSKTFTSGGFRVEQEIDAYQNEQGLTMVHLTAYDQNNLKVAELKKVIMN